MTNRLRKVAALGALALALALPACDNSSIRAAAIDAPLRRVADRHDAYVRLDGSLDPLQRETYLQSTELLRRILDEAQTPAPVER